MRQMRRHSAHTRTNIYEPLSDKYVIELVNDGDNETGINNTTTGGASDMRDNDGAVGSDVGDDDDDDDDDDVDDEEKLKDNGGV